MISLEENFHFIAYVSKTVVGLELFFNLKYFDNYLFNYDKFIKNPSTHAISLCINNKKVNNFVNLRSNKDTINHHLNFKKKEIFLIYTQTILVNLLASNLNMGSIPQLGLVGMINQKH